MRFCKSFPVFVLLSCYASVSYSMLDAVIVSAARTEQSHASSSSNITTITQHEIESSGASHIVEILRAQSGVLIEDTFGDGSRAVISMRGFSGSVANSNTLILIDGRRLNNIDISNPDLNSISLKDVERIEIIHGGAGVLYGDQAVGGVVNIITKRNKGEAGSIEASFGTYHTAGIRGAYGNNLTENLHYDVSAELRQSDNYRRQNNDIDYSSVFAKTDYQYSNGTLFAELQLVNEDLRTPGALIASDLLVDRRQTIVDFLGDFTNSETEVIRTGLKHKVNSKWSVEGEITKRDVEREIQQSFRGFAILTSNTLKRKQVELTPRLIGVVPVKNGDMEITAGIDVINTDFESEITTSSDKQKLLAEYLKLVFPLNKKLKLITGFRHTSVEDDITSAFTNGKQTNSVNVAEVGLRFDVSKNIALFGRLDQSFRFAKVDELTYVSPGVQLRPQTGESVEFGMRYKNSVSAYKVAGYYSELVDEIAFDSSATKPVGGPFAGANVNFDPTTHYGFSIDTQQKVTSAVTVSASYSFTDASFDSGVFSGKTISGVPVNSASFSINHQYPEDMQINLNAAYVGSRYVDGDNANVLSKLPNRTVINANLHYDYKDWKLNLKINNITNRKYFENANSFGSLFPLPERNILLSASWQFR